MQERRSQPRPADLSAIHATATLPDGTTLSGSVKNLTDHGAMIYGDVATLAVGDSVTVCFAFPMQKVLPFVCTVQHVCAEQNRWGFEFVSSSP